MGFDREISILVPRQTRKLPHLAVQALWFEQKLKKVESQVGLTEAEELLSMLNYLNREFSAICLELKEVINLSGRYAKEISIFRKISPLNGMQRHIIEATLRYPFRELETLSPDHAIRVLDAMITPLSAKEILDFKAQDDWAGVIKPVKKIISRPELLNLKTRSDGPSAPGSEEEASLRYITELVTKEKQKYEEKYLVIKPIDDAVKKIQFWVRQNNMPYFLNCLSAMKDFYKKNSYLTQEQLTKIKSVPGFLYMAAAADINSGNYEIFHIIFIKLISEGDIKTINAFLKNKSLDVSYIHSFGSNPPEQVTALSEAALYGHERVVKIFLQLGADCHTKNSSYTPFIWAARKGHVEVVKVFLEEKKYEDLIIDENENKKLLQALYEFSRTVYFSEAANRQKNNKYQEMLSLIQKSKTASYVAKLG